MKKLIVDDSYVYNREPQEFSWTPGKIASELQKRFKLDNEDVAALEEGKTVFQDNIAFSLEDEEESDLERARR